MNVFFKRHGLWLGLVLVTLLAACNLPGAGTEVPASSTESAVPPTEEAVSFAPEAGTPMRWIDSSVLVYVPPSQFVMGHKEIEPSDHAPAHTVSLDGFWIHQAEVTNQMYEQCVDLGVCNEPAVEAPKGPYDPRFENSPVVNITWQDARTYCEWIGGALPGEAQWELAARGTEGEPYPWGQEEPACDLLNFAGCDPGEPTVVRSYPQGASPFELADTAGNVFEWVNDLYADDYYANSPSVNPTGPGTGETRVVRGSSYQSGPDALPIYLRSSLDPESYAEDLGFRCVISEAALTAQSFAPACQVAAYEPGPPIFPNIPPNPTVTAAAYCHIEDNGDSWGAAVLTFESGTDLSDIEVYVSSGPSTDLTCWESMADTMDCTGDALTPGNSLEIIVEDAHLIMYQVIYSYCPTFYEYNDESLMCEYVGSPAGPCGAGFVDVPGYGCQPLAQSGDCPVGSYLANYGNQAVCVPAGGPPCQGEDCPAACPPGLTFDPEQLCCEYPPVVMPACPVGYYIDPFYQDVCFPIGDPGFVWLDVTVPTCFPEPLEGCWITTTDPRTGAVNTTCAYPCPEEGENGGPCTP